jgi:hypothetical protein
MSILDNAKRHFDERRELKGPIEVPEWGDDEGSPALIYYRVPNMKERSDVYRYIEKGGLEGVVMTLILVAKDENGEPIFRKPQKDELMRSVDPDVIDRIIRKMDLSGEGDDLGN